MLMKIAMLSLAMFSASGSVFAATHLDLLNSESKGIKFQARHIQGGSAYEAQTKGDAFKQNLDELNYISAYGSHYKELVKTYEDYLKEKSVRDDWAKYSPVLTMVYPDSTGSKVVANLQLEVPVFYQSVIFSHDSSSDKYAMRERFLKRVITQNCERLKSGIERYDRPDWEEYMSFVNNLANTVTFKFKSGVSMTVLTTCPGIDWGEYKD